jgi:trigger factor
LKVTTQKLDNCEVLMTVELDEEYKQKLLKSAAHRISKNVKIPGFRPGKAPYDLILRRFGEEALREEAMEDMTKKVFEEALKETKVEPYALATLDSIEWEPLVMKARIPTAPEVTLGDYSSIRLEDPPVNVEDEEIDKALANLQDRYAAWKPVSRPVAAGDLLQIDLQERLGSETLHKHENEEFLVSADTEDALVKRFSENALGLQEGEEKEFTYTYPEDATNKELAGKETTFLIKVKSLREKEVQPLNDDFATMVGDYENLAQLKDKIKADLLASKKKEADEKLAEEMLIKIAETAVAIKWPAAAEEQELKLLLERQDSRLHEAGYNLADYLRMQQKTLEDFTEEQRPQVKEQLKRSLVMQKVIEQEKISVAGKEVVEQIELYSAAAGNKGKEMRKMLSTPAGISQVGGDILAVKAMERLAAIAKGEAEKAEQPAEAEISGQPAIAEPAAESAVPAQKPKRTRKAKTPAE